MTGQNFPHFPLSLAKVCGISTTPDAACGVLSGEALLSFFLRKFTVTSYYFFYFLVKKLVKKKKRFVKKYFNRFSTS